MYLRSIVLSLISFAPLALAALPDCSTTQKTRESCEFCEDLDTILKCANSTNPTCEIDNGRSGLCVLLPESTVAPPALQIRYFANLAQGDSVINLTNTGASSSGAIPTQSGNLCVNVYTFSPDEQLISCCGCLVTPNGLVSLSARNDLISNPLTPGVPTSIVVKLLATTGTTAAPCNAAAVAIPIQVQNIITPALAAWGTTIHARPVTPATPATTFGVTETAFTLATLSPAELARVATLCGFIQANGSGFGICKSCRLGGLGAAIR
jgi:hypothetical protein